VSIYELVEKKSQPLNEEIKEFLHLYQKGRDAYMGRDFSQAIINFEEAKKIRYNDQVIEIYLARSRGYLQTPPPDDWDGVHTMTTK
jgi:adenylate cyclase